MRRFFEYVFKLWRWLVLWWTYRPIYKRGTPLAENIKARMAYFKRFRPVIFPVQVYVGDSNAEGFEIGTPGRMLAERGITGRGIGGDTTWGVRQRIRFHLKEGAQTIYLAIGTNDMGGGFDVKDMLDNYRAILEQIPQAIRAVCMNIPPVHPDIFRREYGYDMIQTNEGIKSANVKLEELVQEHGREYRDIFSVLACAGGKLCPEFTKDGLHFSDEGYARIAALL